MKTIYDESSREELIARIKTLNEHSKPEWGKMTVYQMLKHCAIWEEMILCKTQYKQMFLGRLVGKFALKDMLKDEPVKRDLPTVPSFVVTGAGDVEQAKTDWINLLRLHSKQKAAGFMHPFFGFVDTEQAGRMDYKHIDHHLRQFHS